MARKRKELPLLEKVTITDVAAEGKAIAKVNDLVIFVPYVVPGDVVDLQIKRKKHHYAEAEAVKFHEYSAVRAVPFCQHYGVCGGCKWQVLPYSEQIKYKQKQVTDNLTRIGNMAGRKTSAVITDMDQPLGCAVGNAVEVKEAISVLSGETQGDLLELCLTLGSCMLVSAGFAKNDDEARAELMETIRSGKALQKLADLVEAQGGDADAVYEPSMLPDAKVKLEVPSTEAGYVSHINAEEVGLVSMHLGGGRATKESTIDLSVGVVLVKKLGDRVEAGESLGTIHASSMEKAQEAAELLRGCYKFSTAPVERPAFIKGIVR